MPPIVNEKAFVILVCDNSITGYNELLLVQLNCARDGRRHNVSRTAWPDREAPKIITSADAYSAE